MRNLVLISKYAAIGLLIIALSYVGYLYISFPGFLSYGWQQASGQMDILFDTESVEEALHSDDYTTEQKRKLSLIAEIKEFTETDLGFSPSGSYTAIYNQHDEPLLWVLTACPPFNLKPIQWDYPVLGKLEYKGFFEKDRANKAFEAARKMGWDVSLDEVNAWSTLGVLNDPILSSFLDLSEGRLASLIIHELTHSHIYLPGSVSFNENFASFVGRKGAVLFLTKRYGEHSEELIDYQHRLADFELFKNHMIQSAQILQQHYKVNRTLDSIKAVQLKRSLINSLVSSLDTLPFHKERFHHLIDQPNQVNNTFFTDFLLYNASQSEFTEALSEKHQGDLRSFIDGTIAKYDD